MKATLTITTNNQVVNIINYEGEEATKELLKIFYTKDIRKPQNLKRATIQKIPYIDTLKVFEYWTMPNGSTTKYFYEFEGVNL